MKKFNYILLVVISMMLHSCGEDAMKVIDTSDEVPQPLKHAQVERLPGEIKLSYTIPAEGNILYVEAEVDMGEKGVQKVRSSYYQNSLSLVGFGDTLSYPIKLYTVGRNQKKSEAYALTAKPGLPAIWNVFSSLEVNEDFGGIKLSYENQSLANVAIMIYKKGMNGDWQPTQNFYTSQAAGEFALRGLQPELTMFGFAIKDRWGNQTNIIEKELTPLYEERVPADGFKAMFANLPTEAPGWAGGTTLSNLWSGIFVGTTNSRAWYRTDEKATMPQHFTFDMGKTAKLSRLVYFQRGAFDRPDLLYSGGSVRRFEVWGSTNPDPGGSYNGWTLLSTCELVKPSGLPTGNNSTEDVDAAKAGHEFSFAIDNPDVRFIRIRVLETYGKTTYMWMSELEFYGQLK